MNDDLAAQALFKSVGAGGVHWLFLVRPDGRWAIMRDEERIAVGTGDRASINSGARKFRALTHFAEGRLVTACA